MSGSESQSQISAQESGPIKHHPTSFKGHLLRKAQQCQNERDKYVHEMGKAQGNDVFKYLLLLNCIDCQGYVIEIQLQAHNSFRWSTGIACFGFGLVTLIALLAVAAKASIFNMEAPDLALVSESRESSRLSFQAYSSICTLGR